MKGYKTMSKIKKEEIRIYKLTNTNLYTPSSIRIYNYFTTMLIFYQDRWWNICQKRNI